MLNINNDSRDTIFIDLDGTLVEHNYDPQNIDEVFIDSTLEFVERHKTSYLVLTTSRTFDNCRNAIRRLKEKSIEFDEILCELPTGRRILINDHKEGTYDKAIAINILRNVGIDDSFLS